MPEGAIRTVGEGGHVEFTVQGSRFHGVVAHADSRTAVETAVERVSDEYPDATHVVWAYRLEDDPAREHFDDAGEPGGSAGKPALGVLQGEELRNVVAVVVRYYGGTNLGYGGLVRAYTRAVSKAVEAAEIESRPLTRTVSIEVGYDDSGTVRNILDSENVAFEAQYEEQVTFRVTVPADRFEALVDRIRSATRGRGRIDQ